MTGRSFMASSPASNPKNSRPLSPHLSIYKPQISSVLSIMHRITGVAIAAGSLLLVVWLFSAAYNPGFYVKLHGFLSGMFGHALMIGWTLAFYYHLCNGIRHLFWDIGKGFDLKTMTRTGWAVVACTVAFTALTWGMVLNS
jgi:succinate dehydrogenase / fumarate reductase cytochrome b subunit